MAIAGLILSYYNHRNVLTETSFDPIELKYAKGFWILGILCMGVYFLNKSWRSQITKIMIGAFGICLGLNLYILIKIMI